MQWWDWSINVYHLLHQPCGLDHTFAFQFLICFHRQVFLFSWLSEIGALRFGKLCDVTAGFLVNIFYPARTGALL